ncbi:hypothetical protein N7532_001840 [Penicillium argentinense]|uniref:Rhodopsin domain-containing protein n=1 Tax=Penicillium argentinense TaxID=1131581 RepID=A0A9W9G465_9EURO|nr:uncharacterized protein N7532_001840 [Penicillium argentinense]KAJ5111305.1 hypothetical protein N7532_001840 [Penicillium argentinense]
MRVLIITTIFTVLAALFVAIRLFTRVKLVKNPGYDDLLILGALLSSITFYAFILVERHYGLGVQKASLPDSAIQGQMHYLWVSVPFYNLSLILAKLSALIFYTSIFRIRSFLIVTYITMGFLVIAGLWMVLSGFVFCVPVHEFWSLNTASRLKHCLPEGPVWFTNAGIQIFTDVVILILPMPVLSRLRLPKRQRAGIMLVFGVGIFVIATSSARVYELSIMIRGHDFTKTNAEAAVWSSLEANVSIICACLPPLHPLISRIFSFCFRPQPLHSSPASKSHSHTTNLTSSRKPSVYDNHYGPDGGIFYNEAFYAGPGSYTASIAKIGTNEDERESGGSAAGSGEGIRVVRELRVGSDSVVVPTVMSGTEDHDFEMEQRNPSTVEWDLGDFEFPDYKERMNAALS